MFDSVLEKAPPQRRIGTGTVISVAVHVALIAAITVLTTREPVVKEPERSVVFTRPAARPAAALGVREQPPAVAKQEAPPKPKRPNAIIPPREVPTTQPTPTVVEPETIAAGPSQPNGPPGDPSGKPGGDPKVTGPGGVVNGTGESDQGDPPVQVFGPGMTRPVIPADAFANLYTREAREAQVQGMMIVKCQVHADGSIRGCRMIKALPMLSDAVLHRLSTVRATPSMSEGRAISVDYVFNFNFSIPR